MRRSHHRWCSPALGRDMDLLVFGHAGTRVLVFPTRCGRFYDYENWRLLACWSEAIEAGRYQIVCVDSIDAESVYADWARPSDRIKRHLAYERYLLHEVLPFSLRGNPGSLLATHGCSLGAWHAMNFACRNPDRVDRVWAFSGRYDLTRRIGHYRDLFDGYYDHDIYGNMPSHYVPGERTRLAGRLANVRVIMTVGREDPCCPNAHEFAGALRDSHVDHTLHVWDGEAHQPGAWRRMVGCYIS